MPVRRVKSCSSCRKAKARCSLETPCSRCTRRHLDCHYVVAQPRPGKRWTDGLRPLRPAKERDGGEDIISEPGPGSLTSASASGAVPGVHETPLRMDTTLTTTKENASLTELSILPELGSQPFYSERTFDFPMLDLSESHNWQCSNDISASFSFEDLLVSPQISNLDSPKLSSSTTSIIPAGLTPDSIQTSSSSKSPEPQLSQRTRSLFQGSLTAKMLFSRLSDFTRMISDAKTLPPFIYPPCYLGPIDECPQDSSHQCLPEALAVCTNLCRMFYAQTPGSFGFIWNQICVHLKKMQKEYEEYEEQKKLHALQAALIYGILCAQSMESVPSDDASWVVEVIEAFAETLYDMRNWGLDADSSCPSRSQWVFVESLRRIGCLLYLIDLLLHLDTETPSRGDCPEFFDMPLPCVRELWRPMSNKEWRKTYQDYTDSAKQKGRRGLTLRDLFLLKQSQSSAQASFTNITIPGRPELEEELAEWCEKADDLSMLLWLALTVEGDGQSHV